MRRISTPARHCFACRETISNAWTLPSLNRYDTLKGVAYREGWRLERKPEVIVRVSYVTDTKEARAAQEILKMGLRRALAQARQRDPAKG